MTHAHTIAGLLRKVFASGWPENSEKFGPENGTYRIYWDDEYGRPNPGFVVLAERQQKGFFADCMLNEHKCHTEQPPGGVIECFAGSPIAR